MRAEEKILFVGGAIMFSSFAVGGVTVLTPLYKYAVCGMLIGLIFTVVGLWVNEFYEFFKEGEK